LTTCVANGNIAHNRYKRTHALTQERIDAIVARSFNVQAELLGLLNKAGLSY